MMDTFYLFVLQTFYFFALFKKSAATKFAKPQRCDNDVALKDGLLDTKIVRSLTRCVFECSANPSCVSFNYEVGHKNSTSDRVCELSSARVDRTGSKLERRFGFSYFEKTSGAYKNNTTGCSGYTSYQDCKDVVANGNGLSGIYQIHPMLAGVTPQSVYCDMYQSPGIVILRRVDRSVKFDRTWNEYKNSFGNPETNYWIGLEFLHQITKNDNYELRVHVQKTDTSVWYYARYTTFYVDGEDTKYTLHIAGYSGNSGDRLSYGNNRKFTAKDRDYDTYRTNCAVSHGRGGGWWYGACSQAYPTSLHKYMTFSWYVKTFIMRLVRKS